MAGGKSSRLGREKAFIAYHGKPQVLYLYNILKSLHLDVYISCRYDQATQFQGICSLIIDQEPSIGPLGGIFVAMATYPDSDWMVVACDMPMISEHTVRNLLENRGEKPVTTYKSEKKDFPEVLLTVYNKELFSAFQQAIESKNYSLQTLLKNQEKRFILPGNEQELVNVNTMEELNMVTDLIRGK